MVARTGDVAMSPQNPKLPTSLNLMALEQRDKIATALDKAMRCQLLHLWDSWLDTCPSLTRLAALLLKSAPTPKV